MAGIGDTDKPAAEALKLLTKIGENQFPAITGLSEREIMVFPKQYVSHWCISYMSTSRLLEISRAIEMSGR